MAAIRHAIQISAAPDAIYPLVATAAGFGRWWAEDISESGGAVDLGFFNRATVYRLRLARADAPSRAEWRCETGDEWNGTTISFSLEARGAGTALLFTHDGWRSETDYFLNCNTTWGALMYRLKAAAEGKSPGPLFRTREMGY